MKKIIISEPYLPDLDELVDNLKDIWASKWLTNDGPKLREFESQLQNFLNAKYLSVLNNGHSSLEVGLRALDIKGEVITTPYSFVSTSLAIRNVGAQVVFSDVSRGGVNIDPLCVEQMITERTTAILAVHAYGVPCDIAALEKIAKKHGIKLIFDGAHSFGVEVNGEPISSFGDMSMFSFHATKLFHCVEGGALVVQDQCLHENIRKIRNFGITGPDEISGEGTNAKLNEILAAIGLLNLRVVDDEIAQREKLSSVYTHCLADLAGVSCLDVPDNVKRNYSYFPIIIESRRSSLTTSDIESALLKRGILTRRYFSTSLNTVDIFLNSSGAALCENSEKLSREVLCLPIHGRMTTDDVQTICGELKRILTG